MAKRKVVRDAVTGQFTTAERAVTDKATTVIEIYDQKVEVNPQPVSDDEQEIEIKFVVAYSKDVKSRVMYVIENGLDEIEDVCKRVESIIEEIGKNNSYRIDVIRRASMTLDYAEIRSQKAISFEDLYNQQFPIVLQAIDNELISKIITI